jgi:diguanylate cyclase (GGDEF)-like protein
MERVAQLVFRHWLAPRLRRKPAFPARRPASRGIRGWQLWSVPWWLRAIVAVIIGADLAWAAVLAPGFAPAAHDLALFAALLGCGVATVVLARRDSEAAGVVKDVYAVWELPVIIHLPLLYALAVPAVRMALTQWRDRPAVPYQRAFAAAVTGLAYGCAASVFRAMIPAGVTARHYLMEHAAWWLLAIVCCALAAWAVSQVLMAPLRTAGDQSPATGLAMTPAPGKLISRESLRNDATELCAAALVALGIQVTPLALVIAFPMGTLLQRSSRHAALVNEARADAKTGLLNVAAWERGAAAEVARAVRTSTPLAVALLDLDRFKKINDTYGHLRGDEVLRRIAATITDNLRDYDLAGRFGGEEFVMLLPHTRAVDALRIAERVRAQIAELPVYAGQAERIPVTVSIGVAALDAGSHRELPELLAAADAALYRAKASGRDQVQMISTSRGLSAVQPAPGPGPDGTPGHPHPLARVRGAGQPGDLFVPRRQPGPRGPLAAGCRVHAVIGQLAEAEAVDGAELVAGSASTATSSALAV